MTTQSSIQSNKACSPTDHVLHDLTPPAGASAASVTRAPSGSNTNPTSNSVAGSINSDGAPGTASQADECEEPIFDFSADAKIGMVVTNAAPSNRSDQRGLPDRSDPSDPSDPSADQDEWSQPDEAAQAEQPEQFNKSGTETEPLDCAHYVGEKMLAQVFGSLGNAPRPGFFIVQAPDSAWVKAIHDLIGPWLKRPPGKTRRRPLQRCYLYKGMKISCHMMATGEQSSDSIRETDRLLPAIEQELAAGDAVFIVTDDLKAMPLSLRHASDRIFVVSPPNRKALTALLREIAPGAKRFDLLDMPVSSLTPQMLRLAYRPDARIGPFLRRLKQLATPAPKIVAHKIIPFERLHGVDEVKIWADQLKADLQDYAAQKLTWPQTRRSLLLYGAPGTAKTTLSGAIAAHCNMAFVPTSYAKWQRDHRGHLGDVLRAMAQSFAEARACAPCVLFIDELDTLGSRGENGQRDDWWRSIINALLEQIAGVDSNEGVILIGATNYPEMIDPAILRSGRMEDQIALHPPTPDALARIYADELEGQCADALDLLKIGHMSAGRTGADVVRICAVVRRKARTGKRQVTQEDLITALDQDGMALSADYRRRIAIHEAGHAVVMHQLGGVEVTSVTLMGTGGTGGTTRSRMLAPHVLTPSLLETRLITLMGGRAAEAVLLGEISAGAGGVEGSDLCGATLLAAEAELSLGFGSQGLIWQLPPTARTRGEFLARRPESAEAVRGRLDCAYERACELIRGQIKTVERLAEALLRHRALAGEQLRRLLDNNGDGDGGNNGGGHAAPSNGSPRDGAPGDRTPSNGASGDGTSLGSAPLDVAGMPPHHHGAMMPRDGAGAGHLPMGQTPARIREAHLSDLLISDAAIPAAPDPDVPGSTVPDSKSTGPTSDASSPD